MTKREIDNILLTSIPSHWKQGESYFLPVVEDRREVAKVEFCSRAACEGLAAMIKKGKAMRNAPEIFYVACWISQEYPDLIKIHFV